MKYTLIFMLLVLSNVSHARFIISDINIERYVEMRSIDKDSPLFNNFNSVLENRATGIYYTLQWVNFGQKLTEKKIHYCMPVETLDLDIQGILKDLDNEIKYNKNYSPKMKFTDAVIKLLMKRNPC